MVICSCVWTPLNGEGALDCVMHEKVPVVAAKDVEINTKGCHLVPVKVQLSDLTPERVKSCFYYEGKPKHSKLTSADGILEINDSKELFVSVARDRSECQSSSVRVKKRRPFGIRLYLS